jgi:hypothetical protein
MSHAAGLSLARKRRSPLRVPGWGLSAFEVVAVNTVPIALVEGRGLVFGLPAPAGEDVAAC